MLKGEEVASKRKATKNWVALLFAVVIILTIFSMSIEKASAGIVNPYIWPGRKVCYVVGSSYTTPDYDYTYFKIDGVKYPLEGHARGISIEGSPWPLLMWVTAPSNLAAGSHHVYVYYYGIKPGALGGKGTAEVDLEYPANQQGAPTFSIDKTSGYVGDTVTVTIGGGPLYPKSYTVTYKLGSTTAGSDSFHPGEYGTFQSTAVTIFGPNCGASPVTSNTFRIPTLPQGTYTVKAVVSGLPSYLPSTYTIGSFTINPKLTSASISPTTQEVGKQISVTVSGNGLAANTEYTIKVKIGSKYASVSPSKLKTDSLGRISGTITATVPYGVSAGSNAVTVYVGSLSKSAGTLTVKQGISSASFSPTSANVGSTVVITMSGSAYSPNTAYTPTVTLNGIGVSVSPSSIKTDSYGRFTNVQFAFTVPKIPGGSKEVKLTVGTSTRVIGYLNVVPLITSATMDKTSGKVGSTFTITASGNGFPATTQTVSVKIGGVSASVSPNSVTPSTSGDFTNKMFTVTVPDLPYGTHQVVLTIGSVSTTVASFTTEPSFSASIDKTKATYGETVNVALSGSGLPSTQLNVIVKVGDNQVTASPSTVTPSNGKVQTQVSFTVPTLPLGDYPVTVTLTADTFSITANAGTLSLQGVDLSISSASVSSPILVGRQSTISFKVQNTGNLPASNVKVKVLANGNLVGTTYVTLAAYGSTQTEISWTPSTPGQTEIKIVVDPDNQVAELYENNNEFSTQVVVKHINLVIQNVEAPDSVLLNHEYTFRVTIANTGDYPSGSFSVAFRENGVTVQSTSVDNVDPSSTVAVTFKWTPASMGTVTVEIVADSAGLITESNEADNSYQMTYNILAPELKIEHVEIPELILGNEAIINVSVSNTGNMQADTEVVILEGGDVVSSALVTLPVGETKVANLAYTPSTYGSAQLTVCVDYNNAFEEPDENNNCYATTITIKAPNLKVSLDVPSSIEMTDNGVPVQIVVTNDGNYNASAFTVIIDYSYDQEVKRIDSLAYGESVNIETSLDLSIGYHTITVSVDVSDEVAESSEDDNIVSKAVTVTGADLAIKSVTMPETAQLGETVEITVEVENRGTTSVGNYNLRLKVNGDPVQNMTTSLSIVTLHYTPNETGTLAMEIEAQPVGKTDADPDNNKVIETLKVTAPDLYLSVVAPEIVDAQSSFTVTVSIKNQGDGPANGFSLIATYGDQVQTKQALSCDPGKTLTYTFTFTALTNETYLDVKVDPDNIIKETDEYNNEFNRSIAVRVPDLRVTINAPYSAPINEKQTIQITVTNVGEVEGSGAVTVQVDNSSILSKTVTVEPMKSTTLSAYYTPSKEKYSTYGSYFTVTAKVETDYGTHTDTSHVNVVAPDLTIDYIKVSPEVTLGEAAYISVKVVNKGNYNSGEFTLKLQGSVGTIGTVTIDNLSPGSAVYRTFSWIPEQLGTFTFEAIVDPENKVIEWDESNNKQTQTAVRAPDLAITSVSVNETEFYVYSPYKVKVTVSNIGSATAESIQVSMEYTNNTKSVTIGRLAAGNSSEVILFFTPTTNGTIQVNITVDPFDDIMETNEDNNVYLANFIVNNPPNDLNLSEAQLPGGLQEKATMTLSWSMFGGYFVCAGAIVYGIAQFATTGGAYGRKFIILGIIGAVILTSLNSAISSI